jgi:MraZ protein
MALLVGRHINKIDKKGRVSVPRSFRASFDGQGFAGIYAYPSFKYPAIEACGEAFMARISASLDSLDLFSEEQDDLAAAILESAHALAFDPEGRIVLPPALLAHAGIDGEAVFVGRGSKMQIWNEANYETHSRQLQQRARERGATLRLNPAVPSEGQP